MAKWHKVEGTFWTKQDTVKAFCEEHFGPENRSKLTPAGRITNNHGRWELKQGELKFRYEKDLVWFMLKANDLTDPGIEYVSHAFLAGYLRGSRITKLPK